VQSVLVNQKPKVNAFMKQKWEREKSERREALKRHLEEYKERVMSDKEFAKREEEKRHAKKEREKRKKMELQNRKQRDEDMNQLFENFFGEKRTWGQIADSYRKKYCSAYMPVGEGRFLYEHTILRKENLYETCTGGVLVPIRDPLRECNLVFADGEVLPRNSDNFEVWYRRLPIHKLFLQGKESEIHYLAPDNEQPDFPFVYIDWNVDCEFSEEDDCEEDEENTMITNNVTWDRDRWHYVDY
jgi:hypothetical protein